MKTTKAPQTEETASAADQADWRWADPKTLKVNPAFQSLIPLQSRGERRALEESIKAEGCRDPLLVWQGKNVVLDGHTRRELSLRHNKQVKVRDVELPDEQAATDFILTIQRQRRNLTREAMSYFRGAEYNAVKKRHGGSRRGRKPKDQSGPTTSTALKLAEKYRVAEMTIKRDGLFARAVDQIAADYGDPEVKRKLLGADVRLTQGSAKRLLKTPAAERKAVVDLLIEQGELPRSKKGPASVRKPKEVAQSLVARLHAKGEAHAKSVLEQMAKLLGMKVVEKESGK